MKSACLPRGLLAMLLVASMAGGTSAQTPTPLPPCPAGVDVQPEHLLGLWRAEFEGLPQGATLLLEKHPENLDSVRGGINRNGERGQVSGEIEDGELLLEESVDGVHIAATWLGQVVDSSCGREIRGIWRRDGQQAGVPFVLRKS